MKTKKFLPFVAIGALGAGLSGSLIYKHHTDLEQIRHAYVTTKDQETEAVARTVEESFKALYQGLRTMTLLPGVREIDRYAQSFESNSKQAMQQIYNNTYLNVKLSEVYILPPSLDPDKIDSVTGKSEEPILTFDEFIVGGAAKGEGEQEAKEGEPQLEEVEIHEYQLMKKQLEYLSANFPTNKSFNSLDVPAITGEPVITCDNSEFTKADLDSGNNRSRMGVILTLPIYGFDGQFRGGISGIVRTNVLEKLLPQGTHALVNSTHNYVGVNEPIKELTNATENFKKGQSDSNLIYSKVRKLDVVDRSTWELWAALPDSEFTSMTSVRQADLILRIGIGATLLLTLGLAIAVRSAQQYQGTLEARVQEKTSALQASNRAIKNIMDHVSFGLVICDPLLRIKPGYSAACNAILDEKNSIEGKDLTTLLNLDARNADHFKSVYSQIFDPDFMLGDLSVDYLPTRFHLGAKAIGLTGSVVHDDAGKATGVLFCLADVTNLAKAEEEIERNRTLIKMVCNREAFRQFLTDVQTSFRRLRTELDNPSGKFNNELVRRELHTLKGNCASYGLSYIADKIHELEDCTTLPQNEVDKVEQELVRFLDDNNELLGVTYGQAADFIKSIRLKQVRTILGPIEENFNQLASRLGKSARLHIKGRTVLVPSDLVGVFKVLVHLIRNALDHGMEAPHERGDKPEMGTVTLEVERNDTVMSIRLSDDGKGIRKEKVLNTAISKKLVKADSTKSLKEEEIYGLIFEPGFSTAEAVTDISGRGVGLDAVKKAVEEVDGKIAVNSTEGNGTSFTITIPIESRVVNFEALRKLG
jgi:signal transduction histidine kinase